MEKPKKYSLICNISSRLVLRHFIVGLVEK
jgi:hypothetical protein